MAGASLRAVDAADPSTIEARFVRIRGRTDALAEPLSAEDCALQSMPDASPVKWHLAHTTWFFETFVLERFAPSYRAFDRSFRVLFNSYYNGVGEKHPRPERGLVSRPDLATIRAYRAHVETALRGLLRDPPAGSAELIELGLNHEQQHQELILTDLLHLFSRNPAAPAYAPPLPRRRSLARPVAWHAFAGGLVDAGHDGDGFAFDNEGPRHRVFVAPYELAARPVTNREFARFIADGGYRRPEPWLSLGWDTVGARHWGAPLYWLGDSLRAFTLHGAVELDPEAPVCHVSFFEADAYARWAGARCRFAAGRRKLRRIRSVAAGGIGPGFAGPRPDVRRRVGVDAQRIRALPRLSPGGGRRRRVQRQVHVRPIRAARGQLREPALAPARHVSQLLPARRPLAILGDPSHAGCGLSRTGPTQGADEMGRRPMREIASARRDAVMSGNQGTASGFCAIG